MAHMEAPTWALVPKNETGVLKFLEKYPEYDGRDIVIAILDSGVDPAVAGLQVTSTGKTKVIERHDCSGAGDVNTSVVVKPVNGTIQGLSGRTLKVPSTWQNPSQEYHIGIKNIYRLYPEKLRERMTEQYKEKQWDPNHQAALAEATRKLQEFNEKHVNTTAVGDNKIIKEDLEARIELLNNYEKKFNYVGPSYDCVVFNDGDTWWAAIDTTEDGDLSQVVLLGEYSKTHSHQYLTPQDQFTISINVHDNGNVLEIVGMCSPHGTHVAAIASGYFPESPEKNGVAPGAQIISLTIGDARLDSMETGTSIIRACALLMKLSKTLPIKVINMSYGEHGNWSNSGRTFKLINEIVNKYEIIWVASAGNHGPALCTVGTPPDLSQPTVIGVGAYVSPEMMIAEYSLRQKLPGMPFTWSSCGPTMDGHNGVSICAPGAAITSVSKWTQRHVQLMNGTSMSAPHVAGAVAVLCSGLKQKGVLYSPYNVKRALENTAKDLENSERCSQGYGLLQVEPAFDYLVEYAKCCCRDVRLDVNVNNVGKGILYRVDSIYKYKDFQIFVSPFFLEEATELKTNFNVRLVLQCAGIEFDQVIQYPSYLDLANMQRAFNIRIDPTTLTPGKAYMTTINGFDVTCIEKGPLLRIPITIIKPIELQDPIYQPKVQIENINFAPNTICRQFYKVPELATWALLQFQPNEKIKLERFFIHTMQIQPKLSCKSLESQKFCNIGPLTDNSHAFQVKGGLVLEVTVAKYWASVSNVNLSFSITFNGIKTPADPITMHGGEGIHRLQLRTLRNDEIAPVVTLKNSVQGLRPVEHEITALSERDVIIPERQIYQLILTYNFLVVKATEVTPNCKTLSDMLYESEFESQIWFIFDSNKQLMCVGDSDSGKYSPKLEKGEYVLKLQVRHEKKDLLESYTDLPMFVSQKLSSSISLDVYSSKSQALLHGKKMATANCAPDTQYPIYISAISSEKTAKIVNGGQYLTGTITFVKDEQGKKIDTYPFRYIVPEASKKAAKKEVEKEKTKYEEYVDALRDLRVNWLAKLEGSSEAYKLYHLMIEEHTNHCSIHTGMLASIDPMDIKKVPTLPQPQQLTIDDLQMFDKIMEIVDNILNNIIDQNKLLAYYGIKSDSRPEAAKIKSEMDRQKAAVIDALSRKGIITCKKLLNATEDVEKTSLTDELKSIWIDILKFVEANDSKVILFSMWHAAALGQYGRLLKYMLKYGEDKPSKELDMKIITVLTQLDWQHCSNCYKRSIPIKYPTAYVQF